MKDQNYFDACYAIIKGNGGKLITTHRGDLFLMTPMAALFSSDVDITDLLADRDTLMFLYPEHKPAINTLMEAIEMSLHRKGQERNYCYHSESGSWI